MLTLTVLSLAATSLVSAVPTPASNVNQTWYIPGSLSFVKNLKAQGTLQKGDTTGHLTIGINACPGMTSGNAAICDQDDPYWNCLDLVTGSTGDAIDEGETINPNSKDEADQCAYFYRIRGLKEQLTRYPLPGLKEYVSTFHQEWALKSKGLICGVTGWYISDTNDIDLTILPDSYPEVRAFSDGKSDIVAELVSSGNTVLASTRVPLKSSNERPRLNLTVSRRLDDLNLKINYAVVPSGASLDKAIRLYSSSLESPSSE